MTYSRRKFIYYMAVSAGWLLRPGLALSMPGRAVSTLRTPRKGERVSFRSINYFLDEDVSYDIGFLCFKKAAEGSMRLSRTGDCYKAVLEAETKGFIGFMTAFRKHRFTSHLTYLPKERKFRTDLFERQVVIGKNEEKTFTWMDYGNRTMKTEVYRNGRLAREESQSIPEGVEYECAMSAFYNLRMGVYGPIERGRALQISTIPEQGKSTIDVSIRTREESALNSRLFDGDFDTGFYYAEVEVPKEIFMSRTGKVFILFDEDMLPIQGVVKDYIGFGDINACLRERRCG